MHHLNTFPFEKDNPSVNRAHPNVIFPRDIRTCQDLSIYPSRYDVARLVRPWIQHLKNLCLVFGSVDSFFYLIILFISYLDGRSWRFLVSRGKIILGLVRFDTRVVKMWHIFFFFILSRGNVLGWSKNILKWVKKILGLVKSSLFLPFNNIGYTYLYRTASLNFKNNKNCETPAHQNIPVTNYKQTHLSRII